MSFLPHPALVESLATRLDVAAVTSLALGGIVNDLPDDPTLPIVRVVVRGKPIGPIGGSAHWDCEAEIDIFSEYAGDAQCLSIAEQIGQVLETGGRLIATGWTVIVMSVLDLYEVPDELIVAKKVKRWTMPVTLQVVRAA